MTAYEQGREAYRRQRRFQIMRVMAGPERNPYQEMTGEWADWEEGFTDAYEESRRHPDDLSQYQ